MIDLSTCTPTFITLGVYMIFSLCSTVIYTVRDGEDFHDTVNPKGNFLMQVKNISIKGCVALCQGKVVSYKTPLHMLFEKTSAMEPLIISTHVQTDIEIVFPMYNVKLTLNIWHPLLPSRT